MSESGKERDVSDVIKSAATHFADLLKPETGSKAGRLGTEAGIQVAYHAQALVDSKSKPVPGHETDKILHETSIVGTRAALEEQQRDIAIKTAEYGYAFALPCGQAQSYLVGVFEVASADAVITAIRKKQGQK